jgi:hypothetical protein
VGDVERGLPRITRQASCRLPGGRSGRRGNAEQIADLGDPGVPRGSGRPSAGRYEADLDAERPADGQLPANDGPGGRQRQRLVVPIPSSRATPPRDLDARVRTLLKRMNSPPRPLPA